MDMEASKARLPKGKTSATARTVGASAGFPLGDHRGRRFDRHDAAVHRLVVACTGTNIFDALSVPQGGYDKVLNSGVRPADPRIAVADALV